MKASGDFELLGAKYKKICVIIFDILIVCLSIYHLNSLLIKPDLHIFQSTEIKSKDKIYKDDLIISINGQQYHPDGILETYLDFYKAGEFVNLKIIRDGKTIDLKIKLDNYYSRDFLLSTIISSLFFLLPGVFIYLKIKDRELAFVFHGLMLSVSSMLLLTYGSLDYGNDYLNILIRILDQLSYLFLAVFFVQFSFLYPIKRKNYQRIFNILYFLILIIGVASILLNYNYIILKKNEILPIYDGFHYHLLKPLFIPAFFIVLVNLILSYRKTISNTNRQKLLWIFVSALWGPFIYIFLYLVPKITGLNLQVSEMSMQYLIVVSPITLFIAIYKYSLFDIRLILKRSFVHGILILGVFGIYIAFTYFMSDLLISKEFGFDFPILLSFFIIITIYSPVSKGLQKFADKTFFKINYEYKIAESEIIEKFRNSLTNEELFDQLKSKLRDYLYINEYCVLKFDSEKNLLKLLIDGNLQINEHNLELILRYISNETFKPVTAKNNIFADDIACNFDESILKNTTAQMMFFNDIDIINPHNYGILIGNKKNNKLFTYEDVEILKLITLELENSLLRIESHKNLLFQIEENRKLEELNQIKSYFVSSVTHDLKTPLTSIKIFSEILLTKKDIIDSEKERYLEIIVGECDRLSRLINNVLDFSKIEKGTQSYNFRRIDLVITIDKLINSIKYYLKLKNFNLIYYKPDAEFIITADEDSIIEALYNLVDNAVKYSTSVKEIKISSIINGNNYIFELSDKGIGIEQDKIDKIFNSFYRVDNIKVKNIAGTGLGLSIVKNILDAHNATIEVESTVSYGTTFRITFRGIKDNEIIDY